MARNLRWIIRCIWRYVCLVASLNLLPQLITGKGVLFGYDTVCRSSPLGFHTVG